MKQHSNSLFPNGKQSFYVFGLCLVVISLLLPVKFNSIAIAVLGLGWIVNNPVTHFGKLKNNFVALGFIGFYMLHGIGLLYSVNMDYGGKEMEYKLSMLLVPLIIATGPRLNKIQFRFFLKVFYHAVIVCIGLAIILAMQKYLQDETGLHIINFFTYRNFSTPVGFDPIYFALFIVFGSFAYTYDNWIDDYLTDRDHTKWKMLLPLLLMFVTLVFLSSRMETMVFVFSAFCVAGYYAIRTGKWKIPVTLFILLPILTFALISVNPDNLARYSEMVDMEADYTENKWGGRSIRIEKWKNAVECWMQSPIIGVGTGDMKDELVKTYAKNDFDIAVAYRFNPHNQYLQTGVALGIFGVIVLVILLLIMFSKGWYNKDWLLMVFVVIVSSSMLTESMMERQKGLVFIVFFSCLLYERATLLNKS